MNPLTELEAKFEVPHLTVGRFKAFAADLCHPHLCLNLAGIDTFFSGQGIVLRYRRSAPGEPLGGQSALTYKCRQSPGNIRDRYEFDLFLDDERVSEETVRAFVKVMKLEEHFTIKKESWIYCQEVLDSDYGGDYKVILALYDVLHDGKISRYLEVEIDKDGTVSDANARIILDSYIANLQRVLGVGEPLNKSLYELFSPKDRLFLPETF
jgi:adenylate cyclase class IV